MGSLYLSRLSKEERRKLEHDLWQRQNHRCFISENAIDLEIDDVDIDHIIPTRDNGKDDPSNFALALSSYNRSKQASDLRVARVLARFDKIRQTADSDDRGANLNDVLRAFGGAEGEQRAMTRYVLDNVRDTITHSPKNKLRDFIEYAGKGL